MIVTDNINTIASIYIFSSSVRIHTDQLCLGTRLGMLKGTPRIRAVKEVKVSARSIDICMYLIQR